MKKIIFTITFGLFAMICANAQVLSPEVIASSGGDFQGTGTSLSWTLGEPVTETFEGSNAILTQGFHQGIYTVVNVFENPSANLSVTLYPNPVVDILNIDINNPEEVLNFTLSDLNGRMLFSQKSNESKMQINLKDYASSNYLLVIWNSKGDVVKTYKILKSDNF
ncbi:MAG: hypothetical protein CVU05_08665 [Bacteroidetes bacterium HGW-Bacteroidetes-21]|jgi:hypothetical protein|nr:MAG: hypothetical protein CVU05_08665 [Bacteroidetes bacterium HGW-Bacteroidetes-21]